MKRETTNDITPIKKVVLHPFDKVLIRDNSSDIWEPDFFSRIRIINKIWKFGVIGNAYSEFCLPYNKDTAYLLGTNDEPNIIYDMRIDNTPREEQCF